MVHCGVMSMQSLATTRMLLNDCVIDGCLGHVSPRPTVVGDYHSRHNDYSQLSYFSEFISITVTVTATVIIFPGINYKTVMSPLQL